MTAINTSLLNVSGAILSRNRCPATMPSMTGNIATTVKLSKCTGNTGDFSSTNPLVLACYCSTAGTMPYKWTFQTIWQYADSGTFPGDQDVFNGDITRVQALANG